jgi:hypothetical protein
MLSFSMLKNYLKIKAMPNLLKSWETSDILEKLTKTACIKKLTAD